MSLTELIGLVEQAAEARGEPTIPREFVVEALQRIELGKESVRRYPTGAPSLKGVYDIASKLHREGVHDV